MRWPWSKREPEPEQRATAQGYTSEFDGRVYQAGAERWAVSDTAPLGNRCVWKPLRACMLGCMASGRGEGSAGCRGCTDSAMPWRSLHRNLIRRGEDHHRVYVRGGKLVLGARVVLPTLTVPAPIPLRWNYSATHVRANGLAA